MASSNTEICNLALSHLGTDKEISSLTEKSAEARACNRLYEIVRDKVLADFPWPFATRVASLALVEEDPTEEWKYSYRYPTDAMQIHRILSGLRNDNRQSRAPYRIMSDSAGKLVYSDIQNAQIEYTVNEDSAERYPADFVMAMSLLLAHYIAPKVTAGDPFKLGARAFQLYQMEIINAQAGAVNEEQLEEAPESEFIRARE